MIKLLKYWYDPKPAFNQTIPIDTNRYIFSSSLLNKNQVYTQLAHQTLSTYNQIDDNEEAQDCID
jgi:hypothetical protein